MDRREFDAAASRSDVQPNREKWRILSLSLHLLAPPLSLVRNMSSTAALCPRCEDVTPAPCRSWGVTVERRQDVQFAPAVHGANRRLSRDHF